MSWMCQVTIGGCTVVIGDAAFAASFVGWTHGVSPEIVTCQAGTSDLLRGDSLVVVGRQKLDLMALILGNFARATPPPCRAFSCKRSGDYFVS
jgi:hypothetical protein